VTTRNTRGRFLATALAPALIAASALLTSVAHAGTLQIRDEEHLLSSDDRTTLQQEAATYPFDVRVLTTEAHAGDLDRYVGEQVGGPNMVVVGIDKVHRLAYVHFGAGSRIAPSRDIEQAGNASFKSGDFRAGIEAILNRAKESVGTAPAISEQPRSSLPAPVPQHASGGFPLGWVILGGLVLVAFLALRRAFSGSGSTMYSDNGTNRGWGPGYGPGPGPGYGPGYGGGSGIGSGLIGAGLGGLAGYELGKAAGEREEHERDREGGMLGGGSYDDERDRGQSNWDEGGGGGGWDDSGGGGDWGGGGDDGGGDGGGGGW
jgi:hypothetical protein